MATKTGKRTRKKPPQKKPPQKKPPMPKEPPPITIDDFFLYYSPISIRHTVLWNQIKNEIHIEMGGGCCCCCCCCDKDRQPDFPAPPPPEDTDELTIAVRWTGPIAHAQRNVLAPHGGPSSSWELLASMGWEATGGPLTEVTIQARIRGVYVPYDTGWQDLLTGEDPVDAKVVPVTRYNLPINVRTNYEIQYRAVATNPAAPQPAFSQVQGIPAILELQPPPQVL